MAENGNGLVLPITIDASKVTTGVSALKNRLKELRGSSSSAASSFEQFASASDQASTAMQNTSSQASNTSTQFTKFTNTSAKAKQALTSLSLVAQDLPFGFIGIQNNLPAVFQTFSELSAGANGLKGAFAQIGTALVGPAGLFLAFSVVTSAITYAIKEYGSLTNAVKVLFGANSNAIKSQNDFNKEIVESAKNSAGQVAKINILVATIQNENTSQKDRLAAYRELKRINPDVVAGIDEQNLSTAKSIKLIGENANAQLEFLKLQIKIAGITKALGGLEEEKFQANGKYLAARADELKLINFIEQAKRKEKKDLTTLEINTLASENIQLKAKAKNVKESSDAIADITAKQKKWTNSLTPAITAISKISSNAQNLNEDLKTLRDGQEDAASSAQKYQEALNKFNQLKIELPQFDDKKAIDRKISALEKYGNIVLDTTNYDFERAAALKEIIEIDKEYFKNLDLTKTKLETLQGTIQNYIGYLYNVKEIQKELAKPIDIGALTKKIDTQTFLDTAKLRTDVPAIVDLLFPDKEFNKISEAWGKINQETAPELEKFKNSIRDALISKELSTGVKTTYDDVQKEITNAITKLQQLVASDVSITQKFLGAENIGTNEFARIQEQLKAFDQLKSTIESNLTKPFRDFFDELLTNGKVSFDGFVDLAKDAFKRILAQAIASGIANLIASLLSGGATAGLGKLGAAKKISEILSGLGKRGGLFGSANFSGVQGGGMQMAGAVNLTLRGSDLVGSINRTNTTINRVG